MAAKPGGSKFMNGVPELLVLSLLAREMYGYEIVNAVRESSGQAISVGEGCIYPLLHAWLQRLDHLPPRRPTAGRGSTTA